MTALTSTDSKPNTKKWCIVKWVFGLAGVFVALVGLFLFGLYMYQSKLIYAPGNHGGHTEPKMMSLFGASSAEAITITTPDEVKLRAYWFKHPDTKTSATPQTTLLYLHGNTGNLHEGFQVVKGWQRVMPVNALVLSYRGYGFSEGSPSMKGIRIDVQAALDFLKKHPDVDPERLVLYGHSLGGATALHLAATNPQSFRAVIVENTFTSIRKMAAHDVPAIAWASFVVTENWDNEESMEILAKAAAGPGKFPNIMLISGAKDTRVPPAHMARLWDLAQPLQQARKDMVLKRLLVADCNHSCYPYVGYYEALYDFYYSIFSTDPKKKFDDNAQSGLDSKEGSDSKRGSAFKGGFDVKALNFAKGSFDAKALNFAKDQSLDSKGSFDFKNPLKVK